MVSERDALRGKKEVISCRRNSRVARAKVTRAFVCAIFELYLGKIVRISSARRSCLVNEVEKS